jgi:peptide/nickel transport system substrate-binding protein
MKRRPTKLPRLKKKSKKIRLIIISVIITIIGIWLIQQWSHFFELHSVFIPRSGGTMSEATVGELSILNPLAPNSTPLDQDLQKLLFAGLVEYNPVTGRMEPALATFKVSEDSKTYSFTLKESAKFNNGKKVTTADVIFTFQTLIQNPNFDNHYLSQAFKYVTIEAKSDRLIQFVLTEPNRYFLSYLTTPILSTNRFSNILIEELFDPLYPGNKHPVGAGPYKLGNIVPESDGSMRIFLKQNQHYFKSTPYLDQIVVYVYPNTDRLLAAGQTFHSYNIKDSTTINGLKKNLTPTHAYREYVLPRLIGLFFNTDTDLVGNTKLREALVNSTNKEKFIQKNPDWNRIDSFFFYEGVDSWQEPNFGEARNILRDHGYKIPTNKDLRYKDEKPIVLKLATSINPPLYSRIAQQMAQTWETELSIQLEIDIVDNEDFPTLLAEKNYDILLYGVDFSENTNALSMWHSTQNDSNLSNLTNETVDYLIDEVRVSGAQTDIFQLSQKLEDLAVGVPIATPRYGLLMSKDIRNFSENFGKLHHHADRFFGVQNWYMEQKRVWDPQFKGNKIWNFLGFLVGKK